MTREELIAKLNEEIFRIAEEMIADKSKHPITGYTLNFSCFIAAKIQIEAQYRLESNGHDVLGKAVSANESIITSDVKSRFLALGRDWWND